MEDCTEPHHIGTICWVNSLGIKWERQHQPLWSPARPASWCCILQVSRMQVNTPLSLVVSKLASNARYLMDSANLVEMAQYEFSLYLGTQSAQVGHLGVESVLVISGFYAESSAAVQGKSCVDRAVHMVLMWPCLVDPVEKARLLLVWARSTHMLDNLELILLWKL